VSGGPGRATPGDDHTDYEILAAGWALHALEPDDEERFVAHLAGCAACRRTTAELAETIGELAYAAPPVEPPAELRDRLRAAVAADEAQRGSAPGPDAPGGPPASAAPARGPEREPAAADGSEADVVPLRGRGRLRRPGGGRERIAWIAAAAAAVVAVLALGGWNLSLRQEVDHQRRITAERDAMLEQVLQPGRRMAALSPQPGAGRPVAYVLSGGGKLEVATAGMAPNSAGRTSFWLWGIWDGRAPAPLGRFVVDSRGMAMHTLGPVPPQMDTVRQFAVSIEPGTAKPARPSSIVAHGFVDS
jgi:anti-sigma-K factor RskA